VADSVRNDENDENDENAVKRVVSAWCRAYR